MTLAESLWKRVDMSRGADACWPWTGCRKPSGTGLVSWQGRTLSTHRAAWSVTLGPVPAGAAVRHRCGSPACCNPAHLFLTTATPRAVCRPEFSPEDADLAALVWRLDRDGYAVRTESVGPRGVLRRFAHRVVLSRCMGRTLAPSEVCDHVNGNRLDCRRPNLRCTDKAGNSQSRHAVKSSSGQRGVCLHKRTGKWQAAVGHGGRTHYLGLFGTVEEAAAAARAKRVELGFLGEAS